QNVIERAVVLSDNDYLKKEDINIHKAFIDKVKEESWKSLKEATNDFKKEFIIEVLEKNEWNQTKAAKMLKIQRTYLSRLIRELDIDKI
ncbi:MAG: Fis family transcriptional regulator, partial [Spirochaetes bacterium]|nr:Fis family transcriptional regulator [Spirochaetota bacterium]